MVIISDSFVKHKVKNLNLPVSQGSTRKLPVSQTLSPLTLTEIPPLEPENP